MSTLHPREATVPLWQGDDLAKIADLEAAVVRAAGNDTLRRVGDQVAEASTAASAHDAFVTEAKGRAVMLRLTALPRKKWKRIITAHPARENNADDARAGFNIEDGADELIEACIAEASCDTPDLLPNLASQANREAFLDSLSDGQFSQLLSVAVGLNRGVSPDPKADMSSRLTRTSAGTSESVPRLA